MRQVRRLLGAVAVACSALLVLPSPVGADDEGGAGGTGDAFVDDTTGDPTARAREVIDGRGGSTDSGGSSAGSEERCEWRLLVENDRERGVYDEHGNRLHSDTGRWYEKWCDGERVLVGDRFAVPEQTRRADPADIAREARKSVSVAPPPIETSPQTGGPECPGDARRCRTYPHVWTWLWLDPAWWRTYEATAEAGGVSATVVATPVRATWTTGDGEETVCEGPGVAWKQGMSDDQTYCKYTYRHSSAGQPGATYTLTVTVEFSVSWTSNVGASGALPPITRSASRAVEVGEIQAVETA